MKGKKKKKIGKAGFKKAVSDQLYIQVWISADTTSQQFTSWRVIVHFFISLANNGPQRAFDTYAPTIVGNFGYPRLQSNAMASVGLFLQVPTSFAFSYVSDHFNKRGETVLAGFSCHLLGYILNRAFTDLSGLKGLKYFGVVWTQMFGTFSHPLNIAWLSLTCDDSEQRALAMAG